MTLGWKRVGVNETNCQCHWSFNTSKLQILPWYLDSLLTTNGRNNTVPTRHQSNKLLIVGIRTTDTWQLDELGPLKAYIKEEMQPAQGSCALWIEQRIGCTSFVRCATFTSDSRERRERRGRETRLCWKEAKIEKARVRGERCWRQKRGEVFCVDLIKTWVRWLRKWPLWPPPLP